MVIQTTAESGAAKIGTRRELGELGSAGRVRQHPFPGLKHHRFALRTGRSPAHMVPRPNPLRYPRHAVQSLTARTGGL